MPACCMICGVVRQCLGSCNLFAARPCLRRPPSPLTPPPLHCQLLPRRQRLPAGLHRPLPGHHPSICGAGLPPHPAPPAQLRCYAGAGGAHAPHTLLPPSSAGRNGRGPGAWGAAVGTGEAWQCHNHCSSLRLRGTAGPHARSSACMLCDSLSRSLGASSCLPSSPHSLAVLLAGVQPARRVRIPAQPPGSGRPVWPHLPHHPAGLCLHHHSRGRPEHGCAGAGPRAARRAGGLATRSAALARRAGSLRGCLECFPTPRLPAANMNVSRLELVAQFAPSGGCSRRSRCPGTARCLALRGARCGWAWPSLPACLPACLPALALQTGAAPGCSLWHVH